MKVICYGDSNTYGYDPRSFFGESYTAENCWVSILTAEKGWIVVNEGMNGREIPVTPIDFPSDIDLLIIMLGTNDLLQFRSPEAVYSKMEKFLESLPLERERILLIAPPPMELGEWVPNRQLIDNSIALTKHYKALAGRMGIRFADAGQWNVTLSFDGVHLTEEGHSAFAMGLIDYLNKGV